MLSRVLRTFLLACLCLSRDPCVRAADRRHQRESRRYRWRRASGRHRRGSCQRAAGAARHDDGRQRRVPAAGTAAGHLYADLRPLGDAERHAAGRGPALAGHGCRCHTRSPGRDRERRGHGDGEPHRKGFGDHQERLVERADHVAAGRAGVSRPPQADSRRAVPRRTACAVRARAAADRTTSTTSTA